MLKNIPAPAQLATDFLKFMAHQESASLHTLRAYSLDLSGSLGLGKVQSEGLRSLFAGAALPASDLFELNPTTTMPALPVKGSLATRNRKIASLKSFFRWAYQNQKLSEDFGLHLVCPRPAKKIPHFLSVDEALSVLQQFTDSELNEKTLFLLLYGGGLRVSEACSLTWKQVNFSQKNVLIKGKGSKERLLALPPLVWNALKELQQFTFKSGHVFGKALNTRTAYDWVRRSGQRAGLLRPLHPHALRHSYATHLLGSGANLRTLQALLGHESLQATEKYTHLGIDQLARTMEHLHPLGSAQKKQAS